MDDLSTGSGVVSFDDPNRDFHLAKKYKRHTIVGQKNLAILSMQRQPEPMPFSYSVPSTQKIVIIIKN